MRSEIESSKRCPQSRATIAGIELARVLALGVALALVAGCDDDSSSTSVDAGPDAATATCKSQGFSPTTETVERDSDLEVLFYTGTTTSERLTIDFYFSIGATDGPQTVTFTGEGLDTCAVCLMLHTDCGSLTCMHSLMVQEGTLSIAEMGAVGESFRGTLDSAVFREVDIDSSTQKTTLVPDGQSRCVDDYAIDIAVGAP